MKKSCSLFNLLIVCFTLFSASVYARPVISANPVTDSICHTGPFAHFDVAAADTTHGTTVTYRWFVSTDGGSTWAVASGTSYPTGDSSSTLSVAVSGTSLNGYEYKCVASDSLGTDTSASATLVIISDPVAGTVSGSSTLCLGVSATFTDAAPGGVWTSNNTSLAAVSDSGVVTGIAGGIDTIVYTVSNLCGTAYSYKSITIDSTPVSGIITGHDSLCKGSTTVLTDTIPGGTWSSSNLSVATIGTSGQVTAMGQGMTTIEYTISGGTGCAAIASKTIRIDTNAVEMPITGPTVTCVGHTIDLADANVLGVHTWSARNDNASISSSGVLTGISHGLDTIYYNFTNACNSVDTSIVIEIDTPVAHGALSGPSGVCAGSWIHLSDPVSGGFWLSANSAIAVVDGSGNVTGVSQGVTTISYLFENGCGSSAATATITVYRNASAITSGNDSVGVGNNITLTDSTTGGLWTSGDTSIATINASTGVATGVDSGWVMITYTVSNLCGTSSATFNLYVGYPPNPGSIVATSDSVCIGHSATFSNTVTGGVWSSTSTTIASVNFTTGVVTGLTMGLDTVSYTVTNACGSSTTWLGIYVNSTPVISISGPNIVAVGGNYFPIAGPWGGTWRSSNPAIAVFIEPGVYFSMPPGQDTLIGWRDTVVGGRDTVIAGDTTIVGGRDSVIGGTEYNKATFGSLVVVSGGIDTLHYTITNDCGTADSIFIINVPVSSGINTTTGKPYAMNVYPNPNNGSFTLNLPSVATESAHIVITDLLGETVKEMDISTNAPYDFSLNQPSGVYFLSAATASGNKYATKLIISK